MLVQSVRTAPIGLRAAALVLALASAASAHPQAPDDGLLPWGKVKEIVQKFDAIAPQPPPLETVLLGTFDAATGNFIWGPEVELVEMDIDLPYDDAVDVANTFDAHGIEPFAVQLAPQVTGLASIGLGLNTSAFSTPGGVAHPKPGHGAKKKAGVNTELPTAAISTQRFRGHPLDKGIMQTFAVAAKVAFVVEVVNRANTTQSSALAIDGVTVTSTTDTIDLIVPPRLYHQFQISSGGKGFADRVFVQRPPLIGYFTLEALPLALIYEPPGGKECKQTYTSIRRAGTELRTFRSSDDAETAPVETQFSTMMGYVDIANSLAGAAQNIPDPRVQAGATAVQGAASVIHAAFGSLDVSQDITHTVTDEHALSIELAEGRETATAEGLGPGRGDVFHFLVKPTFAWLVAQDWQTGKVYVTTALLGYEGIASYSARSLREHTMPVPPAAMQDLLLALDPMAAEFAKPAKKLLGSEFGRLTSFDPNSPAPGRLTLLDAPMEYISGASATFWVSHTVEQQDVHSTVDVVTTTTKSTAGFLSYVSKNVPKDEDSSISISQGSSATTTTAETVEVKVELEVADGTDGLMLEVWYDRLFGTFAFRDMSVQSQSQAITGTVGDESGAPQPGAPVLLRLPDRRTVRTYADSDGRFAIRPPVKGATALVLESGKARTRIDWTGAALKDVALRGATAQAASSGTNKKTKKAPWPPPTTNVPPVTAEEKGTTTIGIRGKPTHEESKQVAKLLADVEEAQRALRALEARVAELGVAEKPVDASSKKAGEPLATKTVGPAVLELDPAMKGRMGRLSVRFPEGSTASPEVEVFAVGSDKRALSQYGNVEADLMPGRYTVAVSNRRVEDVEVRSGHVSRLRVGVLRVQVAKGTGFSLHEPGDERYFVSTYGGCDIGLTPGTIEIEVAGQRETVEIRAGEITEF